MSYSINNFLQVGINGDVILTRDNAANRLAMRNGTIAQQLRIYNTFIDASNYQRLTAGVGVNNTSRMGVAAWAAGSPGNMDLELNSVGAGIQFCTANTDRWYINSSGHLIASTDNSFDIGASGATRPRTAYLGTSLVTPVAWIGGFTTLISAPGSGQLLLQNAATTSFDRLQFGGTTSAFPSVKRFSASLQIRLADDTDYTNLFLGNLRFNVKKVNSDYTGAHNDSIIHCGTGITITLPPASTATGMFLIIKDASGASPVSNITIAASGTDRINNAATKTISSGYQSVNLYSDGTSFWSII